MVCQLREKGVNMLSVFNSTNKYTMMLLDTIIKKLSSEYFGTTVPDKACKLCFLYLNFNRRQ